MRCFLIFLFNAIASYLAAGLSIPLNQLSALQLLYNTTNGIEWKWKNEALLGPRWSFTSLDIQPDPCNDNNKRWQGIICSSPPSVCRIQECLIVSLILSNYGLRGTLPSEAFFYSALSSLTILHIGYSLLLTGKIPSSIGSLSQLQTLSFPRNSLTGQLPSALRLLESLTRLELQQNSLTGHLNPEITFPLKLKLLLLFENNLSGTLPSSLILLSQLRELYLDFNLFSGFIPSELSSLSNLQLLYLSYNLLSGTIPLTFQHMLNLTALTFSYNLLTGVIPSELSNLTNLYLLYLDNNIFDGTIPYEISLLSKLHYLFLDYNLLTGYLPSQFSQLVELSFLSLYSNLLSGTISSTFGSLNKLTALTLTENFFTGTIPPELGSLSQLLYFYLELNLFSGTIPMEFQHMSKLSALSLYQNHFTGPIDSNLFNLSNLAVLLLSDNFLTGKIPSTAGSLNLIEIFELSNNQLSGTIISELGFCRTLSILSLRGNALTGTVPDSLMKLTNLVFLHLHQNHLSGEIQLRLESFPLLQQLFLQQNHLVGHLDRLTAYGNKSVLASSAVVNLDVSANLFSGSIPSSLFLLPHIQSISLSLNCFEGALPKSICESKEVEVISLDGLGSADGCENRVMIPFTSVSLGHSLDGGIPDCIWLLSNLKLLNLAGNGLSGTIGSISSMSSLLSMTLSHNYLGGVIPLWLQEKNMSLLDLSHNKLTGDVDGFKYQVDELNADVLNSSYGLLSADRTLKLSVNRLSGDLFTSFSKYASLDILSGNLFSCKYTPTVDKNSEWTSCGSEEYDRSMSVMVGVLGVLLIFVLFYCLCLTISISQQKLVLGPRQLSGDPSYPQTQSLDTEKSVITKDLQTASGTRSTLSRCRDWMEMRLIDYHKLMEYVRYYSIGSSRLIRAYSEDSLRSVMLFGVVLSRFIRYLWVLLIVSLVLSLPIYIMKELNVGHNEIHEDDTGIATHYHMYRWLWTMAFISGKLPAILLMFTTFMCLILYASIVHFLCLSERASSPPQVSEALTIHQLIIPCFQSLKCHDHSSYFWLYFILNISIVGTANGLYLWSTLVNLSPETRTQIQIAFVTFIACWNVALRKLLPSRMKNTVSGVLFFTWLGLLNSVFIPCFVTLLSSPSCYQRIIVPPDEISSSYAYYTCATATLGYDVCLSDKYVVMKALKFSPPFTFSYQCGSTLLVSYIPIYIYSTSLQLTIILVRAGILFTADYLFLPVFCRNKFPGIYWPSIGILFSSSSTSMIELSEIISVVTNNIILFLSFGLSSPILACFIVLNITCNFTSWLMLVGRFLILRIHYQESGNEIQQNSRSDEFVTLLNEQVQGIQSYLHVCKWPVICTSCFFMTLLCWEIAGDQIGWFNALWVPISGILMLLLVILWDMILKKDILNKFVFRKNSTPRDVELNVSSRLHSTESDIFI